MPSEPVFTLQLDPGQVHHLAAKLRELGMPDEALAGATLPEEHGAVLRFQTVPRIGGATAYFYVDKKPDTMPSLLICLMVDELLGTQSI